MAFHNQFLFLLCGILYQRIFEYRQLIRRRNQARLLQRRRNYYPPNRVYRQRLSFEMLSEELCVRRLRFSKESIGRICEMLKEDLQTRTKNRYALSLSMKVTTALNFFASGTLQASTGDISNISKNAARACIHQVTEAIFRRASEFIKYDLSARHQKEMALAFHNIAGFPKVIGAVDGTHVALKAPGVAPVTFINRKGFHSLNVQIVCDAHLRILKVNPGNRGSNHDSFVLRNSDLYGALNALPPGSAWILGDKGYPLRPWLMTPYRKTNNEAQERYNQAHVSTRQVVERTIGVLKSRFRCLDMSGGTLQYSPQKVAKIVVACCALHNFALQEGLTLNAADELPAEMEDVDNANVPVGRHDGEEPTAAQSKAAREQLVANTFTR